MTPRSLKLLPAIVPGEPTYCPTVLEVTLSDFAFEQFKTWLSGLVTKDFRLAPASGVQCYLSRDAVGNFCWGTTNVDGQGDALCQLTAAKISLFAAGYDDDDFNTGGNRAAVHYIANLPGDTPVYLFWS